MGCQEEVLKKKSLLICLRSWNNFHVTRMNNYPGGLDAVHELDRHLGINLDGVLHRKTRFRQQGPYSTRFDMDKMKVEVLTLDSF